MRRRRYHSYHGRATARDVVQVVLCLLVLALVLLVAGLVVGRRYIVYTDDGIRLELPFFRREQPPVDVSAPVDIVQLPSVSPAQPDPEPQRPYHMRAVFMTLEQLETGGPAAVEVQGANTVILDMKGEDGILAYDSALPLAREAAGQTDRVSALLERLHAAGIRVVARVSCFKDNALGSDSAYALLTNSGYRWEYDGSGGRWTNPTRPEVRAYVAGVVAELARLGFDEILLDHCGYPTTGELGWIRGGADYDLSRLPEYINDFLVQARQGVEGTDAVLSVVTTLPVLEGTDRRSGQTAATLAQMNGRVWLVCDPQTDLAALAARSGVDRTRLVRSVAAFAEGEEHLFLPAP